jgi:dUTP pyrophosphatase
MNFLIKPTIENVEKLYENHSTYHEGDSGLDLFVVNDEVILAGETKLVDLGISCQLLNSKNKYFSYYMFARSSISKTPLRLANGVGLIDSNYLGNLKAALHNTGTTDFTIKKGERYVQLARPDLGEVSFKLVEDLGRNTSRGTGGFGSTNWNL